MLEQDIVLGQGRLTSAAEVENGKHVTWCRTQVRKYCFLPACVFASAPSFHNSRRLCRSCACVRTHVLLPESRHSIVQTVGVNSSATSGASYLHQCHSELLCRDGVYSMMAGDSTDCKVSWQHASDDVLAQRAVQAMQSLGWPCIADRPT